MPWPARPILRNTRTCIERVCRCACALAAQPRTRTIKFNPSLAGSTRTLSERLQWMDGPRHVTSPSSRPSIQRWESWSFHGARAQPPRPKPDWSWLAYSKSAAPCCTRAILWCSAPSVHVHVQPTRLSGPSNPPSDLPQSPRPPPRSASPLGGRPPATLPSVASWAARPPGQG